jgi:DNA-binding CsgD family transcriptional regulator
VLNEQAEIRFANAQAEQFLKQEKRLKVKNQRLQFNEREHQDAFLRSSTQIIRASMGMDGFDSDVVILKRDDARNLMMTLTPIDGGEQAFSGVLVTVYDGKQRQLPSAAMIASYFALSASESQLCADLLQGRSLKEIAEQRHKSEATLRSYLKQIFLKTGVNRQSQLVCALLSALMR